MTQKTNLLGQRFDRLVVIAAVGPVRGKTHWLCRKRYGLNRSTIRKRLKLGWPHEKAVSIPLQLNQYAAKPDVQAALAEAGVRLRARA